MRNEAKSVRDNSTIKLVGDKLTMNSKINTRVFEKNPLETTMSVSEPIPLKYSYSEGKSLPETCVSDPHT